MPSSVANFAQPSAAASSPGSADTCGISAADYDARYLAGIADSDVDRATCLRLRYQVYCLEQAFENREEHPDEMETDGYDDQPELAPHAFLKDRATGTPLGTVRLLLPSLPGRGAVRCILPIEKMRAGDLTQFGSRIAEVSRFCHSRTARINCPVDGTDPTEVRVARHATLGLIRGLVEMSARYRIDAWAIVVEPALLRVLRNFGLVFTPVGPLVDHHGRRQPAAANLNELLTTCRRIRPDVWSVITDDGKLLNNGNSDLKASA